MSYDRKQLLLRRTKIIATLGPATDTPKELANIIAAGVNLVRLNFSHDTHAAHEKRIKAVRKEARKQDRIIGILADLQGPKIRVASFKEDQIELQAGATFTLDAALGNKEGDQDTVGIDYKSLPNDVRIDDTLLLDDGRLNFLVKDIQGTRIICEVIVGGKLSNHKGINRKGGGLSAKALTEKDREDLAFAVSLNVDYIAISFPRNAADVLEAKKLILEHNSNAGLIAKIERAEAITVIADIINASDAVMVARGDLGVEIGDAEVPLVQKDIIQQARTLNKPVITATQMMESMITNIIPTRAEVSDVANAVLDNTDAVMLSAETAVGAHPAKVVATMADICLAAERQTQSQLSRHRVECHFEHVDEAIAMATMYAANHLSIKAVVSLTESGNTPLWMSRIRTAMPIYGLCRDDHALRKMSLYRGVYPISFDATKLKNTDVNVKTIEVMQKRNVINDGDLVILTKGDAMGIGGGTNVMKILEVGKVK